MQRIELLICLASLTLWMHSVQAADIPINARVDEVTVYSEGATITRRSQVNIPAGTHRLIFADLPATLDPDTLKVSTDSGEVTLGGIEVERITDKEYVGAQERELRNRLQAFDDRRIELQDSIATAEVQLKLLDSLAAPAGSATRQPIDATNLAAILNTMSSAATIAREKVRKAKAQQRDLDKDIQKVNADLAKIATARKATVQVHVSFSAASAVSPTATIEYAMGDAAWRWVYEARLDTSTKRVILGRGASVQQSSGENWDNAALTLTTARPSEEATAPQVGALFVDLQDASDRPANGAGGSEGSLDLQTITVTGARTRANVVATEYLVDYKIPGRVNLSSDGEPRLYPVAEEALSVELTARVVPSKRRAAYLEAMFTYSGDVPIQGGKVQLYRDGVFVGVADLPALLPGAAARLQFGADERIRVVVRDEPKQSGERGLLSKQRIQEHKQRFEVTNFHSIPVTIEIIDRVPVSENKDVRVDSLKGATPATQENFEGKSGLMLWRTVAQPQQTTTVRHYYCVRYPGGRQLTQREDKNDEDDDDEDDE